MLSQGDLMLCLQCEHLRFPDISRLSRTSGVSEASQQAPQQPLEPSAPLMTDENDKTPLTVNLPPEQRGKHCNANCRYKGGERGDMIQCSLCFIWYHLPCVSLKKADSDVHYWPCPICRQTSRKLENIERLLYSMDVSNKAIVEQLNSQRTMLDVVLANNSALAEQLSTQTERNTQMQEMLAQRLLQIDELRCENQELTRKLSDARPTYSEVVESGKNPDNPEKKVLLLGNSLISRVHSASTTSGDSVSICHQSGATFKALTEELDSMADSGSIKHIYIVGGTRDVDSDASVENITNDVTSLIMKAKEVTSDVTVSSVLPRTDKDVTERCCEVNRALEEACEETNILFVNQDNNFMFRNGSVDKAAYHGDGVHLNERGLRRLIGNLGLVIPSQSNSGNQRPQQQRGQQQQRGYQRGYQPRHRPDHAREHNPSGRRYGAGVRQQIRCYYCSEPGHTKDQCGHGKPVKCNQCKNTGHKAKFCVK